MTMPKHVKHTYGVMFPLPSMARSHYESFGDRIMAPRRNPPGAVVSLTEVHQAASRSGYWREGAYICSTDSRNRTICTPDPSIAHRGKAGYVDAATGELIPPGRGPNIIPTDFYGNRAVSPAQTEIFGWRTRAGGPLRTPPKFYRNKQRAPFPPIQSLQAFVGKFLGVRGKKRR